MPTSLNPRDGAWTERAERYLNDVDNEAAFLKYEGPVLIDPDETDLGRWNE